MFDLIAVTYLGGFVSALFFAARDRAPTTWMADFWLAAAIALWPFAALVAIGLRVYKAIQPRQ
jgi:hypothetical protein